ncbi:MAG: gliding motility-associated C-terminal domain-containing protein [Saprospiraceae bacterium]
MFSKFAQFFLVNSLMIGLAVPFSAQNLVPNPSFEDVAFCPSFFGAGGNLITPPWRNGAFTTADVFNTCATSSVVDVPSNAFGWQQPHTGEGYCGSLLRSFGVSWHEYPQVQLTSPMIADQFYHVGFYVSHGNYSCAVQNIGLYVSANPPPPGGSLGVIQVDPQIYYEGGFLTDTLNWTVVEGYYLAQGGEQWITIGNFKLDVNSPIDPNCIIGSDSYYYFDDVWVTPEAPCGMLDVDLGDDIIACFEYTIDPGLGDFHYVWSTGSTDPTITVNESGVYGLTITDGCMVGFDNIQVDILGNIPVDVGPDSVLICEGETYEIELDDTNGEYVWQDGSTDPSYSIASPGQYSVTYDDGCAQSADTIEVDVLAPPGPFTLGSDTILCDNDEFEISFDADLGDFEWSDGSTESSYTLESEGTYALTISNSCGVESDEIELVHGVSPFVELGFDEVFICNGDFLTFDLDEDQGNYVWQDSSTDNVYEISLPGSYSVTVTNTCGTYDDQILVSQTPLPQIDLGTDIVVCPAQLPDTLDVSGAVGTSVVWTDGSTLPQLIVTTAGMYSVTVTNVCGATADTIQVVVADILPEVILPDDMITCEGDSIWLYSTGDTGDYLWQDGTNNDSLFVKYSGQYILQVSTVCGLGMDTINFQFNADTLFPNLGPDIALCPGNSATLYAGDTFDSYQWQDMSSADSLVVSSPGIYVVSVSSACGTGIDSVLVFASGTPPQLNLVDSMHLCDGALVVLDAGISGVNYMWNDGSTLETLIINVPRTYSLTVSNNCGIDMDTVVIVNGGPLPDIELGNDIQLCAGESQIVVPDLSTADSWVWQDGSTAPTFLVNAAGQISVEVSNVCGSAYDTINASVIPGIPPLNLGNDTALCASDMLLLEVNIPDVSITWFDGSHDPQITVSESGMYTAEISNACGVSADTLIVSPLTDVPPLMLGPDQSLCPGELLTFNPGIQNVQYLWQDGTTGSSFSTIQPGLITLTISNACGTSTDSVLITESTEGPQLNLGPDVTACNGDTVTIQSGIIGVVYTWQDGSANPFFQTSTDVQLMLHIANSCGEDNDTLVVQFIDSPDPDLGPDTLLCDNAVLTLTSNVNPLTTNTWQDGGHVSDFTVTVPGIYSLQQSNNCGSKSDSIAVSYSSSPMPFSLGPDLILCPGESIVLHAPVTMGQLLWQDGSDSTKITANANQVYSLSISNECGTTNDEISIAIDSEIPVVQFDSMMICPGEVLTLDASQPFNAQYTWSTGSTSPSIDIMSPGEYRVTVMTNCNSTSDLINVVPSDDCEPVTQFFIPNIFSPNGDQVNDVFTILFNASAEVISIEGDIFDRWGNHVFGSHQHPFTWDGTFDGEPMNPGVYVYKFTLVYSNGVDVLTEKVTGDVTLVR